MSFLRYAIQKLFRLVLFSLFWLIPKKKKWFLFGAWFGRKFMDSPAVLFQEATDFLQGKGKAFFMVKDKALFQQLRQNGKYGKSVVFSRSLRGFFVQMLCKNVICCISPDADAIPYVYGGKNIFLFPHGVSIKTPAVDNEGGSAFSLRPLKLLKFYGTFNKTIAMSTSRDFVPVMANFNKWIKAAAVVGLPRYDEFFAENHPGLGDLFASSGIEQLQKQYDHVIVYLPTHRSEGHKPMPMKDILDLPALSKLMERTNSLFLIKKHPYHGKETEDLSAFPGIVDLTGVSFNLETLVPLCEIMVSDYSSTAYEFLFLNRPVVFHLYDHEDYIAKERKSFMDFEENAFGPITKNGRELASTLENLLQGKDQDEAKRQKIRAVFYDPSIAYPCSHDVLEAIYLHATKKKKLDFVWTSAQ